MHYTINTLDQLKPILIGYRKAKGLSQKDMGTKLGIKQQSYQYLESNPQKVTVDRLFRVLTLLGVKLHFSDQSFNVGVAPISTDNNSSIASSDKANPIKNTHKEVW